MIWIEDLAKNRMEAPRSGRVEKGAERFCMARPKIFPQNVTPIVVVQRAPVLQFAIPHRRSRHPFLSVGHFLQMRQRRRRHKE